MDLHQDGEIQEEWEGAERRRFRGKVGWGRRKQGCSWVQTGEWRLGGAAGEERCGRQRGPGRRRRNSVLERFASGRRMTEQEVG